MLFALLMSGFAHAEPVHVDLRHQEGETVLNKILAQPGDFWSDAWSRSYDTKAYDLLKLKSLDSGYVPMITGEGLQDFRHDVVADVVYTKNTQLPNHMSGVKLVIDLGHGYDSTVGAEYRDTFYVLDLTLFYGTFPQRMYKKHDPKTNTTVLWFEKMDPSWVPPETWSSYNAKMKTAVDNMQTRWLGSSIVEVGEIYGMFVVKPGKTRESRVSFVSRIAFDENAGWIARAGSQMPSVIRSGLKNGFLASVSIADETQKKQP